MLGTCPEGSGVNEVREWGRKGGKRELGGGQEVTEVKAQKLLWRERGMVNNGEGILQKWEYSTCISKLAL